MMRVFTDSVNSVIYWDELCPIKGHDTT